VGEDAAALPPSRCPRPSRGARGGRSPIPRCWPGAAPRSSRLGRCGRRSWRRRGPVGRQLPIDPCCRQHRGRVVGCQAANDHAHRSDGP